MLVINSILHFIIDGICAYMMFGVYGAIDTSAYLYYNLCAFALQMPFGVLADFICIRFFGGDAQRKKRLYQLITVLGILLTVSGMFTGYIILGTGNALFHVGGGLRTILDDHDKQKKGSELGIFVSPGAVGLFAGKLLSSFKGLSVYIRGLWIVIAILGVAAGTILLFRDERKNAIFKEVPPKEESEKNGIPAVLLTLICSFAVVIIRSFVAFGVEMPWKNGVLAGLIATFAVALGKAAGGILSARIGQFKCVLITLLLAAGCFAFSAFKIPGILALFFFNMTMPITLYLLIKKMPDLPGFSFGLLTFGLFMGFLPVYGQVRIPFGDSLVGVAASVISLILLLTAILPGIKRTK